MEGGRTKEKGVSMKRKREAGGREEGRKGGRGEGEREEGGERERRQVVREGNGERIESMEEMEK